MLVFGPYRSIPKDENFDVYNFSSLSQAVPRLPGLFVVPNGTDQNFDMERSFDMWYYNYVLEDRVACTSLMQILMSLYEGHKVYVCIGEYSSDPYISMLNESFMKILQTRYGINYSIINDPEDYNYIPKDGCDFMSVDGIYNFDQDKKRFIQLSMEDQIASGGIPLNM